MTMRIARYDLPFKEDTFVEIPEGSRVFRLTYEQIPGPILTQVDLCVRASVWAIVEVGAPLVKRHFVVVKEGDAIANPWADLVGTVALQGSTAAVYHVVYHVFDGGDVPR